MIKPINSGLRYVLVVCLGLVAGGCAPDNQHRFVSRPIRSPRSQSLKSQPDVKKTTVATPQTFREVFGADDSEAFNKAWAAYRQLRWQQSKHIAKKLLKNQDISTSDYVWATILLGAMAYQEGDLNQARHYFQKAGQAGRSQVPSDTWFPPPMIRFYRKVNPSNR